MMQSMMSMIREMKKKMYCVEAKKKAMVLGSPFAQRLCLAVLERALFGEYDKATSSGSGLVSSVLQSGLKIV